MKKTIAIILCVFSLLCLLAGCGKEEDSTEVRSFLTEQLEMFKNADKESVDEVIDSSENEAVFYDNADLSLYYKNLEYTIGECKQNGDTATAEVTIKNLDFGSVFNDYLAKLIEFSAENAELTEDEYNNKLMEESGHIFSDLINNGDYKLLENTVTVKMSKIDGKWTVDNTEEFTAALLPGLDAGAPVDDY